MWRSKKILILLMLVQIYELIVIRSRIAYLTLDSRVSSMNVVVGTNFLSFRFMDAIGLDSRDLTYIFNFIIVLFIIAYYQFDTIRESKNYYVLQFNRYESYSKVLKSMLIDSIQSVLPPIIGIIFMSFLVSFGVKPSRILTFDVAVKLLLYFQKLILLFGLLTFITSICVIAQKGSKAYAFFIVILVLCVILDSNIENLNLITFSESIIIEIRNIGIILVSYLIVFKCGYEMIRKGDIA